MCSASCFNSRESGFAVTNENKITPKGTNILRMYLLNCCFGLNKNDDFDNYEYYYQWRALYVEQPGWSLRYNAWFQFMWDSTVNWYSSSIVHIFVLLILLHYMNHWCLIVTINTKNNGNNFLTLEQLHTFFNFFFFKFWFYSPILFTMDMISVHKEVTSQRPQTSKNPLGLVNICDRLVKFKHGYRESRICN